MIQLSGDNWSGSLLFDAMSKASGRVNGYSWHFQSKGTALIVEISEDPNILPSDLPLVGYGCGGWLYQRGRFLTAWGVALFAWPSFAEAGDDRTGRFSHKD